MDTEQGTNPVHKTEPAATDATVGRAAAAVVPAGPDPRVKGAALVFWDVCSEETRCECIPELIWDGLALDANDLAELLQQGALES